MLYLCSALGSRLSALGCGRSSRSLQGRLEGEARRRGRSVEASLRWFWRGLSLAGAVPIELPWPISCALRSKSLSHTNPSCNPCLGTYRAPGDQLCTIPGMPTGSLILMPSRMARADRTHCMTRSVGRSCCRAKAACRPRASRMSEVVSCCGHPSRNRGSLRTVTWSSRNRKATTCSDSCHWCESDELHHQRG